MVLIVMYHMAGIFQGSQFLRLTGDPQKLNQKHVLVTLTRMHNSRGCGHYGECHCWIDLIAGLLHMVTSSLWLSFFYTNASSLDHMRLSCHFSMSAKFNFKYDRSIACWFFITFSSNEI